MCEWCGVATANGNHGTLAECVEALQREVTFLRDALAERDRLRLAEEKRESGTKPSWKFRTG